MKKATSFCLIILLFALLAVTGCTMRSAASASPGTTPGAETTEPPTPTPEPTPSPIPYELVPVNDPAEYETLGGITEVSSALEAIAANASRAAEENPAGEGELTVSGASMATGSGVGDTIVSQGNTLYILSDNDLVIVQAAGEETRVLSRTPVGVSWKVNENAGAGTYSGREKIPTAVFCDGTHAAIVCDWYGYDSAGGTLVYSDYASVDIYDVSDPASPLRTASFGQDGSLRASGMSGGALYLVTQFECFIDEEGHDPTDFIPAVYSNDAAAAMDASRICWAHDGRFSGSAVIGVYDLSAPRIVDVQALLGVAADPVIGDNRILFASQRYARSASRPMEDERGVGQEDAVMLCTDIFCYGFDTQSLALTSVETICGGVPSAGCMDLQGDALRYLAVCDRYYTVTSPDGERIESDRETGTALYLLDGERSVVDSADAMPDGSRIGWVGFSGDTILLTSADETSSCVIDAADLSSGMVMKALKEPVEAVYLQPFGEERIVLYSQTETGKMTLTVYDKELNTLAVKALASDHSHTLENHRAYLADAEHNLITLTADDSFCVYGYSEADGIFLQADVYLTDWAWHALGVVCGDALYVVDTKEVVILDLKDFARLASVAL